MSVWNGIECSRSVLRLMVISCVNSTFVPRLYDVQTFKFAAKPFAMICDTGTSSKGNL